MPINYMYKHTDTSFCPRSTDLLHLQLAQVPRLQDLAILNYVFVSTTMTTTMTEPITLSLAHVHEITITVIKL